MGARVTGRFGLTTSAAILAAGIVLLAASVSAPAAQAGGKCRGATAAPGSTSVAKMERNVLCLLNKRRAKRGLSRLSRQGELDRASLEHSRHMVRHRCFAHECPGEQALVGRLKDAGYLSGLDGLLGWGWGENIAWGSGGLGSVKAIVRAWMRSDGHRHNILNGDFDQIGIAVVRGSPVRTGAPAATYTTDFGYRRG